MKIFFLSSPVIKDFPSLGPGSACTHKGEGLAFVHQAAESEGDVSREESSLVGVWDLDSKRGTAFISMTNRHSLAEDQKNSLLFST